jgi:hypothetical protein
MHMIVLLRTETRAPNDLSWNAVVGPYPHKSQPAGTAQNFADFYTRSRTPPPRPSNAGNEPSGARRGNCAESNHQADGVHDGAGFFDSACF